jgi:hypothetical protein
MQAGRVRDFALPPTDLETQRKRTKRQRFVELALPCAVFAALVIAAFFSTGHHEASRRFLMARAAAAELKVDSERIAGRDVLPGVDRGVLSRTAGLVALGSSFHTTARRAASEPLFGVAEGVLAIKTAPLPDGAPGPVARDVRAAAKRPSV